MMACVESTCLTARKNHSPGQDWTKGSTANSTSKRLDEDVETKVCPRWSGIWYSQVCSLVTIQEIDTAPANLGENPEVNTMHWGGVLCSVLAPAFPRRERNRALQ
jgi:hypothetical protein